MKSPIRLKPIFLINLFLFMQIMLTAQDWQWKWGAPGDKSLRFIDALHSMGTDHRNLFCTSFTYNDSIVLPDTTFCHNYNNPNISNVALAFYQNDGTYIDAVDIYTNVTGNILKALSCTDTSGNTYVAVEFQIRAYLNSVTVDHGPGPYPSTPDIFIAKLGPDREVKWVRLIWGTAQSKLQGLAISADQQIYVATFHYNNNITGADIYYFGQDSSHYFTNIESILKIDGEGNLKWRKEIRSEQMGAGAPKLFFTGEDGTIYDIVKARYDCYIDQDTLFVPSGHEPWVDFPCLLRFNPDGDFLGGKMIESLTNINDMKAGLDGALYFAGFFYDSTFIANDTLLVGADSIGYILGKTDENFEVGWYQATKVKSSQVNPMFHIVPDGDNLYFASTFFKTFQFAGQTFTFGTVRKPLIGKFLPDGTLDHYVIGQGLSEMYADDLVKDNCNNLLLTGRFSAEVYFGKDTLHGLYNSPYMGFLQVNAPLDPGLGQDTVGCSKLTLRAAPGFSYYSWNNGSSMTDSLEVTETGWVSVTVHNDHFCWATDSVFVTITIPPERLLGNDTMIYVNDSLPISLTVPYDHCLWSTGDTASTIMINGKELGLGKHTISVSIENGPCKVSDSIQITVAKNQGTEEMIEQELAFYPNPFDDKIMILLQQGVNKLSITDTDGKVIGTLSFDTPSSQFQELELSWLSKGIYIIQVSSGQNVYTGKMIKR
jgi:hypothetical protein